MAVGGCNRARRRRVDPRPVVSSRSRGLALAFLVVCLVAVGSIPPGGHLGFGVLRFAARNNADSSPSRFLAPPFATASSVAAVSNNNHMEHVGDAAVPFLSPPRRAGGAVGRGGAGSFASAFLQQVEQPNADARRTAQGPSLRAHEPRARSQAQAALQPEVDPMLALIRRKPHSNTARQHDSESFPRPPLQGTPAVYRAETSENAETDVVRGVKIEELAAAAIPDPSTTESGEVELNPVDSARQGVDVAPVRFQGESGTARLDSAARLAAAKARDRARVTSANTADESGTSQDGARGAGRADQAAGVNGGGASQSTLEVNFGATSGADSTGVVGVRRGSLHKKPKFDSGSPPPGYHISWKDAAKIPFYPGSSRRDKQRRKIAVEYLARQMLNKKEKEDMQRAESAAEKQLKESGMEKGALKPSASAKTPMDAASLSAESALNSATAIAVQKLSAATAALAQQASSAVKSVQPDAELPSGDSVGEHQVAPAGESEARQGIAYHPESAVLHIRAGVQFEDGSNRGGGSGGKAHTTLDCSAVTSPGVTDELAVRCTGRHLDGTVADAPTR